MRICLKDSKRSLGVASLIASLLFPAMAMAQNNYQGNTLNFTNVTSSRINQTVDEGTLNEKEVEYGDIDNDGDYDVVIAVAQSDFGRRKNKIYINNGGVFDEVSGTAIMPEFSLTSTTRNAFLRDFDNDGWLDIITVNDSNVGDDTPQSPGTTKLYINKHPNGVFSHFENQTSQLDGITGAACSAVAFDFDQNGLCDLYMANYPFTSQDDMALNGINGDAAGIFTQVTGSHVRQETDYAVDVNAGDMNGDGKLDLLVASIGDPNFILYNDNQGDGSGVGDFSYAGNRNRTQFGNTNWEGAMDPADFDGDGKVDFLFINKGGFSSNGADVIMLNNGNDFNQKATFVEYNLHPDVDGETKKATIVDLDDDGKLDIILMADDRRPYIYRNVSTPGNPKFVEWTPGAIQGGSGGGPLIGWHANAFDPDGDARKDIMMGAFIDDHLFKNVPATAYQEADLTNGALPTFQNSDAISVVGRARKSEIETYTASGISSGSNVSVVLRSYSNVALTVKDSNGQVIASSDEGLFHVTEAVQFDAPGGDLTFEVEMIQLSGDGNNDGRINFQDARMVRSCFLSSSPACLVFDLNGSGRVTLQDSATFRSVFQFGPASAEYVIEFNSRSN